MTDRLAERELVYCHACASEWYKDDRGLECPNCHGGAVEIIDRNNDPRTNHIDLTNDSDDDLEEPSGNADALPQHPLHNHNPWADNVPDPDESDIEHVTFNPAPGVHIQQTTFRGHLPSNGTGLQEAIPALLSSFAGMLNNPNRQPPVTTENRNSFPPPGHQYNPINVNNPSASRNPTDEPRLRRVQTNVHVFGAGDQSITGIHAILQTMINSVQAQNAIRDRNDPHARRRSQMGGDTFDDIMQALIQLRDPRNATVGDAVFTDEAMDRIISQMMEQHGSAGSAPGPATNAAIAALPKKQADEDMVGTDGKAECSVCMDAVLLGDEVTVLPCKHWFHGDCVGAWLKEHDTCPHCRQGIMPKDAPTDANEPRSPGESPRHTQSPWRYDSDRNNSDMTTAPLPGVTLSPIQRFGAAQRIGRNPPQSPPYPQVQIRQGRHVLPLLSQQQPMPGAWTQPGMQQPYVPGGYPGYPEPRDYVQPPQTHPLPPAMPASYYPSLPSPMSVNRRQSSSRASSNGSGNGEGSSSSSRIGGWWRNLRSGGGSTEPR